MEKICKNFMTDSESISSEQNSIIKSLIIDLMNRLKTEKDMIKQLCINPMVNLLFQSIKIYVYLIYILLIILVILQSITLYLSI